MGDMGAIHKPAIPVSLHDHVPSSSDCRATSGEKTCVGKAGTRVACPENRKVGGQCGAGLGQCTLNGKFIR